MKCSGVKLAGYWKGSPCNSVALYEHEGKKYCASHLTVAKIEPERFDKALHSKPGKRNRNLY